MTKFLIDSWAWVEYLEGGKAGRKVKEEVDDEFNEIFTHVVSIAEITSKVKRKGLDVEIAWNAITTNSKVANMDKFDSKEVGLLHAKMKSRAPNFSLGDAFVLAAAKKLAARVLTGDPDFENVDGVESLNKT